MTNINTPVLVELAVSKAHQLCDIGEDKLKKADNENEQMYAIMEVENTAMTNTIASSAFCNWLKQHTGEGIEPGVQDGEEGQQKHNKPRQHRVKH